MRPDSCRTGLRPDAASWVWNASVTERHTAAACWAWHTAALKQRLMSDQGRLLTLHEESFSHWASLLNSSTTDAPQLRLGVAAELSGFTLHIIRGSGRLPLPPAGGNCCRSCSFKGNAYLLPTPRRAAAAGCLMRSFCWPKTKPNGRASRPRGWHGRGLRCSQRCWQVSTCRIVTTCCLHASFS